MLFGQFAAFTMEPPRALHHAKFIADRVDALADGATVGFDLRLTGASEEAETAALALKMRPGADEPAFLIGEARQFDLQPAFLAARAVGKDLENKPGSI